MSFPKGESVNDGIDIEEFSLKYSTVDDAMKMIQKHPTAWLCKLDLAAAYQSVGVRKEDVHLTGFSWPDASGKDQLYTLDCLPFGLRSSPWCFNNYADAILWIAQQRGIGEDALHYLDDYLLVCCSAPGGATPLEELARVVEESGFEVNWEKTYGPARVLEFLGFILDTILQEIRISLERLQEILELLKEWQLKKFASKRELLTLIGKLQFCSRVIRDGRFFTRRLIDLSKTKQALRSTVTISPQAKADIDWWISCIASHNGVAMFPVPFNHATCEVIQTDASDLAGSAIYGNEWTMLVFKGPNQWLAETSIAYRELACVLLALSTFGEKLAGKQVLMNIDNQVAMAAINNSKSTSPKLMELTRALYMYTTRYHIQYQAIYITSLDNSVADSVSRCDLNRFFSLLPSANRCMTEPVPITTDY